jgi:hypothetical protein
MSNPYQPVKAKCSPATFSLYNELLATDPKTAAAYKESVACSMAGGALPMGYVASAGPDKGKLFPFSSGYTDPNLGQTGTCWNTLKEIDAATWNSLPINSGGVEMTKNSFCNLATVGEADKIQLAAISKELIETAQEIYTKIQNMEKENLAYYNQHQSLNEKLSTDISTYKTFYHHLTGIAQPNHTSTALNYNGHRLAAPPSPGAQNNLWTPLENQNSQPDVTLGGQMEDARLKATFGYYQFIAWGALAAFTFSYTMLHLKR